MMRDTRRKATTTLAVAATACSMVLTLGSGAAAGAGVAVSARAAARGAGWGSAQEVPGTAALNRGGNAQLVSVSCGSAGNCSAGGVYRDSSGHSQAFVVNRA